MARSFDAGTLRSGNNRTQQQFQRVLPYITPKLNWVASDFYNHQDLNRVEHNTSYINDLLDTAYSSLNLTFNEERVLGHWEFYDSLNRVETNIKDIRDVIGSDPVGWEEPVTTWQSVTQDFSFVDANRLERNIEGLRKAIISIPTRFVKSGTSSAGNNRTRQLFSR